MFRHIKTVCIILAALIVVGLGMWGAEILLDNYKNQQWDQFIEQAHCRVIGEKPKEGFFSSAQTIYRCDNTGIYYRNKQ